MNAQTLLSRVRRSHGFTIIEIVIVMTIIGLLAAIALPQINLARYQTEAAMQSMGTTLLTAQRMAVTRQHNVVIRFDQAGSALFFHEDANNDGVVNGSERDRRIPLGEKIVFGRATAPVYSGWSGVINFTKQVSGMPAVIFRRNGSASEAGAFYITSQRAVNSGQNPEDTRMVEVERSTGRASWYRYNASGWAKGF